MSPGTELAALCEAVDEVAMVQRWWGQANGPFHGRLPAPPAALARLCRQRQEDVETFLRIQARIARKYVAVPA